MAAVTFPGESAIDLPFRASVARPVLGQVRIQLSASRLRLVHVALSVAGVVILAFIVTRTDGHGADAFAYWVLDATDPYAFPSQSLFAGAGAFRYAPPIAVLLDPVGLLPWDAFRVAWLGLQLAGLWYVAGRWALALVVFPPVALDLLYGNINVLLAAAIVAGFRHRWAWSFVLLTKVTPAVAMGWFVGRRDWRGIAGAFIVSPIGAVSRRAVHPARLLAKRSAHRLAGQPGFVSRHRSGVL